MAALDPAVAAVRTAVRRVLATESGAVLVACSGGADSLALAAATAFVAPRLGVPVGLVTVDHQLQSGSAQRANAVAEWGRAQGFAPVLVETVSVAGRGGGPEAAARDARYESLVRAAAEHGACTVLLGHTRDDQAETVLLALLRGSGSRGLAAMPARRSLDGVTLARPLLDTSRQQTRTACAALGLDVWEDPHNRDPSYARPRARVLLESLVDSLGPAVVANLARTATLAAADAEALDALATAALPADPVRGLEVSTVEQLPAAVRTRVLHAWVRALGVSGGALARAHVAALDALVTGWRGQGPVHLPGGVEIARRQGWLTVTARGGE